ncbi:FAD-binding oxidoreductase [Halarsenatibacter silvermanii]|uniref:Ferredoxin-NADP reductase n=1 Tax=Halarsenatibacter silvermanii TaxID=321763 RepID=A0A1G9KUA5_9FIRM|nr:FAD-binding oxidoreductase [Halarsenatibacter silvermanii]SDL53262.1 Ferredoxin-NADP reductase [Halarsenatibacter silvermanii]
MSEATDVSFNIKTDRTFSWVRDYGWTVTLLIGIGGHFLPHLGLLVPPIMAAMIIMSLMKGKYWCGNFCPHGSFFDELVMRVSRSSKIPNIFKSKITIGLVLIYFIYNMSSRIAEAIFTIGEIPLHHSFGFIFARTYLMVVIAGGLLGIAINSRTWCQFCPMGTMQVFFYKIGQAFNLNSGRDEKVTIEHPEKCLSCGQCSRVCPMELTPYQDFQEYDEHNQFEAEKCIRCKTCVENCPADVLQMADSEEAAAVRANADLEGYENYEYFDARIAEINELKDDVREYTFELIDPGKMDFHPGQFLLWKVDSERKIYKAYTISSAAPDNSEVTVTIKKIDQGYGTSIIFSEFSEGDRVELKGPLGEEITIDTDYDHLLMISNGIGITPFVSTVEKFLTEDHPEEYDGEATLLYGVRYEENLVYDDFFTSAAEENDKFDYHHILSRPRTNGYPEGYVTHILEDLEIEENTGVYMCGTPAMVSDAYDILDEKGISREDIYHESFAV